MENGAKLIADERDRQIADEGWGADHDDEHRRGDLADAAVCYAARMPVYYHQKDPGTFRFYDPWPWSANADKRDKTYMGSRDQRVRQLVKAGALIAAEIDRLLRINEREETRLRQEQEYAQRHVQRMKQP